MSRNNFIESGGFYFIHNFDSGNLGHVERVPTELITPSINVKNNQQETPDYEFNLWTRPDCAGTEFENGNRSWFYFGIQASEPHALVRLNLINLNKQGKMYTQGMAPVTRTLPGKPHWERIRDRPVHSFDDNAFTLSFKYRTSDNTKATTFFAFTYPFSFAELQIALNTIDSKFLPLQVPQTLDDIYYCRECLIYSLEGRRVDLLTISSYHGIMKDREERLKNMFPEKQERPFKFNPIKKIIFMSARVHPGETPSSFVFNGFLNLLLNRTDPIAIQLRRSFVFKLVPFLNPDGVARGHYRTDTRGVNLNRVYLNPSLALHPTVYAARALIRYYHFGCEKEDIIDDESVIGARSITSRSMADIGESVELITPKKKTTVKQVDSKKGKNTQTASKRPSTEIVKKDKKNADESLSEKVCDLKIQEFQSQTSESALQSPDPNRPSVLNPETLKNCLGSNVQLSTSEELNKQPSNPLRPLRDALKNSISLLMDSTSTATTSSIGGNESKMSNIKVGFCLECRRALDKLEDASPGIASTLPSYNAVVNVSPSRAISRNSQQGGLFPPKYNSIHEYRTHQRQMLDKCDTEDKDQKEANDNETYLCTNCFKRYKPGEEIEIELGSGPDTNTSNSSESRGDSGSVRGEAGGLPGAPPPTAAEGGDSHTDTKTQSSGPTKGSEKTATKAHQKMPPKRRPHLQVATPTTRSPSFKESESGLYLYIDLHGHASKKGIFMYGNHFDDLDSSVECMLLPRIMSLNNLHFHFSSCNFTERNMYLKDRRDGMSREGSGRVAVLKATGLVRSYTLECNYNTGRLVNVLPPPVKEPLSSPTVPPSTVPPKYTPHIYEEVKVPISVANRQRLGPPLWDFKELDPSLVGRSLGASILDLTGLHPNSRIPSSEHRNINSLREWLRQHTKGMKPQLTTSRLRPNISSPNRTPLYPRPKTKTEERKENTYQGAKSESERRYPPTLYAPKSGHEIVNVPKIPKKESKPTRSRYMADSDKPKIQSKRRNILSIRKPNSKTQIGGIVKAKTNRRFVDDSENPRHSVLDKMKRAFTRSARAAKRREGIGLTSSSSDDIIVGNWEDVNGTALETQSGMNLGDGGNSGKRRSFPVNSPSRLKKIRLKAGI